MADSEPAAVTAAQAETASRSARALRSLYLFRTGFSAFWVALVFALASARALAQYSAGGAIWYLLTALWLTRAARSRPGPGGVSSPRPGRRSTAPGGGAPC
jgi:hypothetical protein